MDLMDGCAPMLFRWCNLPSSLPLYLVWSSVEWLVLAPLQPRPKARSPRVTSILIESPMPPEVGTQSEFKKKLPPKKYRYDDSLSPVLEWDGQNAARERGEARIAEAEAELSEARKKLNGKPDTKEAAAHIKSAQEAVRELKAMSKPFLNWSGKAERLSFDVPTLPLFIHERLSTKAILETLKGHKRDKQTDMFDLFGDPQHSITDQVLRAYEHKDKWVNRMILGDSLVVMNSLLHYENC